LDTTKALELAGAATLIISLIFIGYEIRLANRIALVETEWEMFNSYAEYNALRIEKPELFVEKKINELSELERISIRAQFYRTLNIWLAAETAFNNNMISEATFLITLADAQAMITIQKRLGTAVIWEEILSRYPFLKDSKIIQLIREGLDA